MLLSFLCPSSVITSCSLLWLVVAFINQLLMVRGFFWGERVKLRAKQNKMPRQPCMELPTIFGPWDPLTGTDDKKSVF